MDLPEVGFFMLISDLIFWSTQILVGTGLTWTEMSLLIAQQIDELVD